MQKNRKLTLSLYRSLLRTCRQYDLYPHLKAHAVNPQFVGHTLEKWLTQARNQILSQIYGPHGIYYKPHVAFENVLRREFRATVNSLKTTKDASRSDDDMLKYEKLEDSKIDDAFAVFKLLNDNLSAAHKSGCTFDVTDSAQNQPAPLVEYNTEVNISPGTILVAHPLLCDRMERKVILIVQTTKKFIIGIVLNGKAESFSVQKKITQPKKRIIKETVHEGGADGSDLPVVFEINPDQADDGIIELKMGVVLSHDMLDKLPKEIQDQVEVLPVDKDQQVLDSEEPGPIGLRQFQKLFEDTYKAKVQNEPYILYEIPEEIRTLPITGTDGMTIADVGIEIADSIFYVAKKNVKDLVHIAQTVENTPDAEDIKHYRHFPSVYQWTRNTLDEEIKRNQWLTIDASQFSQFKDLLFPTPESEDKSISAEETNKIWAQFVGRMGGEYSSMAKLPVKLYPFDFEHVKK